MPESFGLVVCLVLIKASTTKSIGEHKANERARDRATRLQSSDTVRAEVKPAHERQPDAKDRDVVAVQLDRDSRDQAVL